MVGVGSEGERSDSVSMFHSSMTAQSSSIIATAGDSTGAAGILNDAAEEDVAESAAAEDAAGGEMAEEEVAEDDAAGPAVTGDTADECA